MKLKNSSRVFIDTWFVRISRIIGWAWGVFWALMAVMGLGEIINNGAKSATDVVMPLVCLGLAALHYLLIRSADRIKALLDEFHLFCAVFAKEPDKSIPGLAAALKIPEDKAMERLQAMCRRKYFNGFIDYQQRRLLFYAEKDLENTQVVSCPGCGARNAVGKAGALCRYCGAPLNL